MVNGGGYRGRTNKFAAFILNKLNTLILKAKVTSGENSAARNILFIA